VELRVLGPVEVAGSDGPISLSAPKPRALLAAFAIERGSTRTTDELIDALWGESPPASAGKLLQVYVAQLRRILPPGISIVTRGSGYALDTDPGAIDAVRFERLVADGRDALRADNPALAASILSRALALWRGPAYADVRYEPFAQQEVARLERMREHALEDRIEADLRLGRHAEIVAELRGHLATDPAHERLGRQAMLAAYRAGQAPEALAIFAQVRDALQEELGEEPSQELTELRDRIARRDPTLDLAPDHLASAHGSALPVPPSALIGRARELAELRGLLARADVRLVSLTGAGGSGKSRLALELARELEPGFANGAALVELAALTDPDLVPATIARALGLDAGRDALGTLADALADRELLLVLDNVEHLRAAAPGFVTLLARARRLVILATSQAVLHVSGEHVYPVAPLTRDDAVRLFAERARAQDPSFDLDPATRPTVTSIVQRVDNLPLSIELAAARVRTLGLRELDARLAKQVTVLGPGPRDLPARQQTLRETLAWSTRLLDPAERSLLARIAVFAGGFTFDAAARVGLDGDEGLAFDLLERLVHASLVVAEERDAGMRYRLFESVREYATELLAQAGELDTTRDRHADWCLELAERTEPDLTSDRQAAAFATLDTEHDNIRAALGSPGLVADQERRLRLTVALSRFWYVRGYLAEGRRCLEGALTDADGAPSSLRRRALTAAAAIALLQGDYGAATSLSERSLVAARETGEQRLVANGLSNLGAILLAAGQPERAAPLLGDAVALAREVGDARIAALAINNLGDLALTQGDYARAEPLFTESLAFLRERGDTANVARSLFNLGSVALMLRRLPVARERYTEALALGREAGDQEDLAWCLLGIAGVASVAGDGERAAMLLGAAEALLDAMGAAFKPFERRLHDTTTEQARDACGADAFEDARRRGAALELDEAITLATAAAAAPR
jgi:predicted ATPase/DNA-binding SARP family transcriptional activator